MVFFDGGDGANGSDGFCGSIIPIRLIRVIRGLFDGGDGSNGADGFCGSIIPIRLIRVIRGRPPKQKCFVQLKPVKFVLKRGFWGSFPKSLLSKMAFSPIFSIILVFSILSVRT